ncbi:6,7-dimethyl-8-ribityllumazine synthase [bacterium]|nr:6,7-dimethyl-8-ribityllumazine synthase [bacterium]
MQSEHLPNCCADGLKVAVVVSRYHDAITKTLCDSAVRAFEDGGGQPENCVIAHATGAWELPVLANSFATKNEVDAIVALGCIITGETTHDKVIGDAIANGLMHVATTWGHPVAMGVLTCQSLEQASKRSNKGKEAMIAAIETANTLKGIRS